MATPQHTGKASITKDLDLSDAMGIIQHHAIEEARRKLPAAQQDQDVEELLRRSDFVDYFKYELAKGIAQVLAINDDNVLGVYVYDPNSPEDRDVEAEAPINVALNLIVKVARFSAALGALMTALELELIAHLKELPSPMFANCASILNANFVTEEDVQKGKGFAAMLSSMHTPPLRVWPH